MNIKYLENKLLEKYDLKTKVEISKKEFDDNIDITPHDYFLVGTYGEGAQYYKYAESDTHNEDIKRLLALYNNETLNRIERSAGTIKNILLFWLVLGITAAVIWIFLLLANQ